jgi:hypothetical protein
VFKAALAFFMDSDRLLVFVLLRAPLETLRFEGLFRCYWSVSSHVTDSGNSSVVPEAYIFALNALAVAV